MRFLFQSRSHHLRLSAVVIALLLSRPTGGWAQTPSVPPAPAAQVLAFTGAVFSPAGLPLPGATVTVAGPRQIPVITNADGFFILQLPMGAPVTFVIAYPGFASQQIELRAPEAEKNLVVTLAPLTPAPGTATRGRRSRWRLE